MVGSAICKVLISKGFNAKNKNLLTTSRKDLDLENEIDVESWFRLNNPDIVIIAAAQVGGIMSNQKMPVDFLLKNLKIQNNLIEQSYKNGVKNLIFLGSSCIYPKLCKQPIKEEYLLESSLEETNQWYAIAKIGGIKLCEAYKNQYNFDTISLMPPNLYGPKDNYNLENCHVLPALIRKFYEAKINQEKNVICWGSGKPLREFLFVEDFADACIFILENWLRKEIKMPKYKNGEDMNWINVGSDFEISIKNLTYKVADIIGFKGEIVWDKTKPDGTLRKKLDTTFLKKIGWNAKTNLDNGIRLTLESFKNELINKTIRI